MAPQKPTSPKPAPEQEKPDITRMIERLGLPTALLLGGAYVIWNSAVLPLVDTAKQAISDISITNKLLEQQQKENDKADAERVQMISEAMKRLDSKLDKILEKVDDPR